MTNSKLVIEKLKSPSIKVIIQKSRREVVPVEQYTIDCEYLVYCQPNRNLKKKRIRKNIKQILCNFLVQTLQSTCLRHQNLQNIRIQIPQIFCYEFFCLIKSRRNRSVFTQLFLNANLIFFSNAPQIVCRRIIKKIKTMIWRI